MKRPTPTLFLGDPNSREIEAALNAILAPAFELKVLRESGTLESDLQEQFGETITRDRPALIFQIASPDVASSARLLMLIRAVTDLPVVVINDGGPPEDMIQLLRAGADDFITTPLQAKDVLPRAWRFSPLATRPRAARSRPALRHLIGESELFIEQVQKIPQIAACEANVLISGETGTGKELYARAIHYSSPRAGRPFMQVN
jgi:DNA-binding NtrC family response regulator